MGIILFWINFSFFDLFKGNSSRVPTKMLISWYRYIQQPTLGNWNETPLKCLGCLKSGLPSSGAPSKQCCASTYQSFQSFSFLLTDPLLYSMTVDSTGIRCGRSADAAYELSSEMLPTSPNFYQVPSAVHQLRDTPVVNMFCDAWDNIVLINCNDDAVPLLAIPRARRQCSKNSSELSVIACLFMPNTAISLLLHFLGDVPRRYPQ